MDQEEFTILEALDTAVRAESVIYRIDAIVSLVEQKLRERPDDVLAWEPIPLDFYIFPLPESIRSSWVFVLRASTTTGTERHPNSHQRMMSYRGFGDLQTRLADEWCSHLLTSEEAAPMAERWISIPPNVWHQGVVGGEDWVVVSFHTAAEDEFIEERPVTEAKETVRQRKYLVKSTRMDGRRVDFASPPWQTPLPGVRYKVSHYGTRRVRLVEFAKGFVEPDWCTKGHMGYVLDGKMDIDFDGYILRFCPGDDSAIAQ